MSRLRQVRPSSIAWGLTAVGAALYPATLYLGLSAPANVPPVLRLGWWGTIGSLVGLAYCVVGSLIIRRHPRHLVGWLASLGGFATIFYLFAGSYAAFGLGHPLAGSTLMAWIRSWFWFPAFCVTFFLLPAVFPDGRLPSKRWRLLVWLSMAGTLLQAVTVSVNAPLLQQVPGTSAPADALAALVINLFLLVPLFGSVAAVVLRFQRSRNQERQQMKWFAAAVVLQGGLWLASLVPALFIYRTPPYQTPFFEIVLPVALLALPVAIGVAILRQGLYDIDLVLSRGLAYAALGAFVTGAYLALVVGVGVLVGTGGRPNLLLSILATAGVGVLFQPVRARVQVLANRLVYGTPSNPYDSLARLADSIGTGTVDAALLQIAQSVAAATAAERARVSLVLPSCTKAFEWPRGAKGSFDYTFPIRHDGKPVGWIELAGIGNAAVAKTLSEQAGLALRNLRLSAELADRLQQIEAQANELRASRARLVSAQETERRRLERDLHDGVQQELVALMANLRLARNQLKRDPSLAAETLGELQSGIQRALTDLREVAHGIHPAVLSSQGLVEAVEAIAGRMPIPVHVTADAPVRGRRFPPAIEGAAYFVVAEGLTNVLKHSGAEQARVSIAAANSHLDLEISDDGHGFQTGKVEESGLRGLRDRVEALEGTMTVDGDHRGTHLRISLPVYEHHNA